MYKITVKDILDNSYAKLLNGNSNLEIKKCCVDSRKVTEGACFFGIEGNNINGSLFYKEALERGAKIVVINKIYDLDLKGYSDRCVIVCKNVLKTLQDIASYKRSLFKGKVIGITGSVGKTSTKNMIVDVLKNKYNVLTNNANQNSQVGLPLTILRLTNEDIMVLEMGMSMPGEMHKLSMIAKPDISIITNIGSSHMQNFNTKEDLLKSKLEILDGIEKGIFLLNNDDKLLKDVKIYNKNINIITYGINNESDFKVNNIMIDNNITFDINDIENIKIYNPYSYIYNATLSVIIGYLLNIENEDIKRSLLNYKNEPHRLEKISLDNNITLIDDSYNSSLDSIKSALDCLDKYNNKKIFVIGDILELGKFSKDVHKKVGELLNKYNIDILITIGKYSRYIGKENKNIWLKHFRKEKKSRNYIKNILKENDVILIKGSNGMNLINVVDYLKEGLF